MRPEPQPSTPLAATRAAGARRSAQSATGRWLARCAAELAHAAASGQLPAVSSALSCKLPARARRAGAPDAAAFERALWRMSRDYQRLFARTLRGRQLGAERRLRVLSLCTGFDASAELAGLLGCFGPLAQYTSVELDDGACRLNRALLSQLNGEQLAEFAVVQGDVRGSRKVAEVVDAHGPFDACIVVHPPVASTAYGNRRGQWLKPQADRPVMMDLLCMQELGIIGCPLLAVLVEPWELAMLQAMGSALGLQVRQANGASEGLARLRRGPGRDAYDQVDLGAAYANFGRHALVVG